jgi:translocation protein SEC72
MREELSAVISNRSAAYLESGDYISALADAETVIAVRRPWNKGHFRKAKALVALGRHAEAKDAIRLGLAFEPTNTVSTASLVFRVLADQSVGTQHLLG